MHFNKKNIPNCITGVRLVGAVVLFFVEPFSTLFYLVYTLCGITDVLDGLAARKLDASSELGSLLDSIADLLFYAAMLFYVIPYLWRRVPVTVWYVVGLIFILRIVSYSTAWIKYHRFASLHTYGNKITGLCVFAVPYLLLFMEATMVCVIACTAGVISTVEELLIHLKSPSYDPNAKTIFYLMNKKNR